MIFFVYFRFRQSIVMPKKILLLFCCCLCFVVDAMAQFDNYKWTILATKGNYIPREECDFVNVKGKFYLIGGRKISPVEVFDPKTQRP